MSELRECMLIDDDPDDQDFFTMALEELDTTVRCVMASNGAEALARFRDNVTYVPDFIFLDVNMPRMNGIECLREINKIERLKNTRVIMYSTTLEGDILESSKKLGAKDFIVKPASISMLAQNIGTILCRK